MDSDLTQKYKNLNSQHKRYVNKLIRGLSSGAESDPKAFKSVCRSINRNIPSRGENRTPSAYIKFYKANYPAFKTKHPNLSLPQIGRQMGAIWQSMSDAERAKWDA
jgi:hypothetical protein